MKIAKIDKLGRIVLPVADRKVLGLCANDTVIVEREENRLIITPERAVCRLCQKPLHNILPLPICASCMAAVKRL